MALSEKDFTELTSYYRDQFLAEGKRLGDRSINDAFDQITQATSVDNTVSLRNNAYTKSFNVLTTKDNDFMLTNKSRNNGQMGSVLRTNGNSETNGSTVYLWDGVTDGSAAYLLEKAVENKDGYSTLVTEYDNERATWKSLLENASTDSEKEMFQSKLDEVNKAASDYHKHYDDAVSNFNKCALRNEIANTKKSMAEAYRGVYGGQGDTSGVNDYAKKLATLEVQYFNAYEKNSLQGEELRERQSVIDKLTELYPDCDKYEYSFGDKYNERHSDDVRRVAIKDTVETSDKTAQEKTSETQTSFSSESCSYPTTDSDKRAYIADFESKYASSKDSLSMNDTEYVTAKRDYIRYKQDLNMQLTDADKKWAIADFEQQTPSISSTADAKAYEAKKSLISQYKNELDGVTVSRNVSTDNTFLYNRAKEHSTVRGNPYNYAKPVRTTGMSDAAYTDLCKQTEQEHIAKINNEMADKVIRGEYGNGQERFDKLSAEGYNYSQVQQIVNQKMAAYNAQAQAKTEAVNAEASVKKTAVTAEKTDNILARVDAKPFVPSRTLEVEEEQTLQRVSTPAVKPEQTVYVSNNDLAAGMYVDNENVAAKMQVKNAAYTEGITDKVDNTAAVNRITNEIDNTAFSRDIAKDVDNASFSNGIAGDVDNTKFSESIAADVDNTAFSQKTASDIDNSGINHRVDDSANKALASNIDNTVAAKLARFDKILTSSAKTGKKDVEIELDT